MFCVPEQTYNKKSPYQFLAETPHMSHQKPFFRSRQFTESKLHGHLPAPRHRVYSDLRADSCSLGRDKTMVSMDSRQSNNLGFGRIIFRQISVSDRTI